MAEGGGHCCQNTLGYKHLGNGYHAAQVIVSEHETSDSFDELAST